MIILPLIAASFFAPTTNESAPTTSLLPEQTLLTPDYTVAPLLPNSQDDMDHDDHTHTGNSSYVRLTGGFMTTANSDGPDEEIDFDEGYLASLAFGHRFGAMDNGLGFAMELDGIWTDSDVSDSGGLQSITDVSVLGALINGIVDFRLGDRFTIYGGAGVGAAWLDVGRDDDSGEDFDDEDGPFLAWQVRAGVGWSFTETLTLHAGYRFLNIDDAELDEGVGDSSFDLQTEQHTLEIGLMFGF